MYLRNKNKQGNETRHQLTATSPTTYNLIIFSWYVSSNILLSIFYSSTSTATNTCLLQFSFRVEVSYLQNNTRLGLQHFLIFYL